MNRPRLLAVVLVVLTCCPPLARADERDDVIAAALGRSLLGPRQSLEEARAFVAARLPEPATAASAEEWTATVDRLRQQVWERVIFRGEAARWREAPSRVEWLETIEGGPGYRIKKLRFEVIPGLWVPALLYEPTELRGKVPVVLNVNGHDAKGKAAPYKQVRCINQAKRGMIALNLEWFGMGQLAKPGFQHGLINAIDLCGSGGIAMHFLAMRRGLDILLAQEHADSSRVAVTGLSGGGWQTIFFSSLEPRVTLSVPVAGYSGFRTKLHYLEDLGDSEQTPSDLATLVDYTDLTAMLAPRPALLTFNAKDNCCFAAPHALPPLIEAAAPIYRLFGREGNLRAHVNEDPGDHNYGLDNRQAFYQMTADFWSRPGQVYRPKEIPSDDEIKTAEQLAVALPDDNLDFQKVALALAAQLPEPANGTANDSEARRLRLRSIVRPLGGLILRSALTREEHGDITAQFYTLRIAEAWTVPVVRLEPREPTETVLLLADGGRKEAASVARRLLDANKQVVAIDPYYFGEAKLPDHDYLWSLMIGTVGDRPLGVQVGEVLAAARAHRVADGAIPTSIVALGPRTSTIALIAAALAPETIDGVELHRPLGSLKEVLEEGRTYSQSPELFCFGLLRAFDLKQVALLVAPRPVRLVDASERAKAELGTTAGDAAGPR